MYTSEMGSISKLYMCHAVRWQVKQCIHHAESVPPDIEQALLAMVVVLADKFRFICMNHYIHFCSFNADVYMCV